MEEKWNNSLFDFKKAIPQCLISTWCCLGVGCVQASAFEKLDKGKGAPIFCSIVFCCIGTACNRRALRKHYRIGGNYFLDLLLHSLPLYCCAAAQEYSEVKQRRDISNVNTQNQAANNIKNLQSNFRPSLSIKKPSVSDSEISISLSGIDEDVKPNPLPSGRGHSSYELEESSNQPKETPHLQPLQRMYKSLESSEPEAEQKFNKEIAITPIDGEDTQVYSWKVGTAPFSFLKGETFNSNSPPPTYLPLSVLKAPKPVDSQEIMFGLQRYKKGGLVCVDEEAIKKQSGVVKEVMGQILSNLKSGGGSVGISLPVRIFEPRSTCERMVDRFSFATTILKKASQLNDPLERFKQVMAFSVSGLYLGTKQDKPFNPLLGETFQGYFPDGTEVYVEHTSHNPPIDNFDIIGDGYRMWGYYLLEGKFNWNFNTLRGEFGGTTYVYFTESQQLISYTQPKFSLGGVLSGDRTLNWEGEFEFKDNLNNFYGSIRIGDDKHKWLKKKNMQRDDFVGKIWEYNYSIKKQVKELAAVEGSWLRDFKVFQNNSEQTLWKLDESTPQRHLPVDNPLPSDWRYREDLIWLYKGNLNYAANWKHKLELRQRQERELRKK